MALAFVPGLGAPVAAASIAAGVARGIDGEAYDNTRKTLTWTNSAIVSFLPTNPVTIPLQLGLIIIITLVLIFGFKVGIGTSILAGYVVQGVLFTVANQWLTDKILKFGFGI